ncbi:hypothetical protein EI94DRAFT_867503 [Lactarius quietus]|nr:hypothetical protein EI94DRAFT_867503 [Lactarius quietus]
MKRTFFPVRIHTCHPPRCFLTYRIDLDFIDQTHLLLSDMAAAPGKAIPVVSRADLQSKSSASLATLLDYLFNFILTSAMIPAAPAVHLDAARLAASTPPPRAPRAQVCAIQLRQPQCQGALATQSCMACRRPLARDHICEHAHKRRRDRPVPSEHDLPNVVVSRKSFSARTHGPNKHLAGFLWTLPGGKHASAEVEGDAEVEVPCPAEPVATCAQA